MTQPNRLLSIQDCENIISSAPYCCDNRDIAQQLLDTMRENERLKQILDSYTLASHWPEQSNKDSEEKFTSSVKYSKGEDPPEFIEGIKDGSIYSTQNPLPIIPMRIMNEETGECTHDHFLVGQRCDFCDYLNRLRHRKNRKE